MKDLHTTLLPCRNLKYRGGYFVLTGVSNFIQSDSSFPMTLRRLFVFVRLSGAPVRGRFSLSLLDPDGEVITRQDQDVPPFNALAMAETWFDADWLVFSQPGRYHLVLELDGKLLSRVPMLVLE